MTKKLYTSDKTMTLKTKYSILFLLFCLLGNISNTLGQEITLVYWDFSGGVNTPTTANVNNTTKTVTTVGANAPYSVVGAGGLYTNSFGTDSWASGSGSKYWQAEINTTGYKNIKVTSYQGSSNTGPRNFKLQYRVGTGTWTDVTGGTVPAITGDANSNNDYWNNGATTFNLSNVELPADVNDIASITLRWIMTSNTQRNSSSNVASNGSSRIDEITITGELACELPSTPAGTVATVGSAPFCGSSISFTYSGAAAPSGIAFFWQSASNGESTAFPLSSNPTFTITGTGTRTAYLRARRTDGGCWSAGNKSASGTVYAVPGITLQPINRFIAPNANTTFSATASGTVTSRQWQVSTDNGGTWANITNTAPYSGTTTATLSITNATTALHQNQYRMVASNNGCSIESDAATLSLTAIPVIVTQPAIDYTSCNSATIALTALNVLGTTADLNYTWYVYHPTTNDWSVITNNAVYDGAATATLIINSMVDLNSAQYYVKVNYKNQTCYSASRAVKVTATASTTRWDGTSWTNATPNQNVVAILDQDYDTATGNLTACSIDLNGKTITINEDEFVRVQGNITGTGTIDIKDSGSLIQIEDRAANGTQWTLKMERITKKMFRYDFTYWGSPLTEDSAFTLKKLSTLTLFDKYYQWNANTGAWTTLAYGTPNMVPGRGYIVRAPQNYAVEGASGATAQAFTANFIGRTNNGIVPHDVVGDSGTDKWNLLSNPYPSALDIEAFLEDNKTLLDGTIYLWTHNTRILPTEGNNDVYSYNPSDYASYNFSGAVATKGQSATSEDNPAEDTDLNNNIPTQYLAAGQAFFVKGLSTGTATFSNLYRGGSNNNFFRPAPTAPIDNWEMTGKHRVWLNLTGTDAFNQILVGYVENATNELDWGYDGAQFGGNKVTLYSILDNNNLVIQGKGLPFNHQDQVPLGYKTTLTGTLKISIDHYDGLFEGQDVYLEDKLLNIVHDLKQADYTFATVPGTFNERFVLRYLPLEELGTPGQELTANGLLVYKANGAIRIKSALEALQQVTVYDLLGRTVFEKDGIGENELGIENIVMNEQPLIVKVKLADGSVVSRKIVY